MSLFELISFSRDEPGRSDAALKEAVLQAYRKAHVFHSKKPMGLCLLVDMANGQHQCIPGFNIENSAYAASNHAGLVASTEMLSRGFSKIDAIAMALTDDETQQVSLACLNTLIPYCQDSTKLLVYRMRGTDCVLKRSFTIKEFLPHSVFGFV